MMYDPPQPGEILKEDILPALGLMVTQVAEELGINRVTLSRVLNGKAGISIGRWSVLGMPRQHESAVRCAWHCSNE